MRYLIENKVSGTVLGAFAGKTESEARDAMARDAGYDDYADLQSVADDDDLLITPITDFSDAKRYLEDQAVALGALSVDL